MVPLLLAAVGGLFTECAGVLNIALEGLMLFGAFAGVVTAARTGSVAVAILGAAAASGALAFVYGLVALRLRANIFVAGIATNLLASGLTTVLADRLFGYKGVVRFESFPRLPVLVPAAALAPLGPAGAFLRIFLDQNLLVPLAWLLVAVAWVALERTPFGLRLKGTGRAPEVVASVGGRTEALGATFEAFRIGQNGNRPLEPDKPSEKGSTTQESGNNPLLEPED